ncbi:ABC transporter permease [Micromonospora sp. NPDC049679]|uniref:ABC transporter permease n=1 Tax=Micromonospora sp. NPDC049679 TaxID=3155920 RepID=UPI0033D22818
MTTETLGGRKALLPPAPRLRVPGRGRAYLLLAPAVALVGAAFVYPIVLLLYLSFTNPEVGFGNYVSAFTDGISLTILWRTMRVAAVVTLVTLVLAYPYAYVMTVVGPKTRAVMVAFVLMPFWTSLMARTFAWVVLLQENGPVNSFLSALGAGPVKLLGTGSGVTLAMTQVLMPFMTLPLYATLSGIDRRLVDAALGLGARPVVAFLKVYLPLSMPGLVAGGAMVYILSLGFYVTPALIGSPSQSMMSQLIGTKVQELLQFGGAGALSAIMLVVTLLLLAVVSRVAGFNRALARLEGDR